jgi:UDP-3-O-[3-hydroxymyristoyl] N-acetylglucosamine deacetylase
MGAAEVVSLRATGGTAVVRQRTLKNAIRCSGVALHSGAAASIALLPAAAGSGIVFQRTDLPGAPAVRATWDRVVDTCMCTTLGDGGGVRVGTVEHLMAALAGCGIDNLRVEVDGPEVPIMDGSAEPFVRLIEEAGVVEQESPRRVIRVLKPVAVADGKREASLAPARRLELSVEIDFECGTVAHQAIRLDVVNGTFCRELARARTFGFLSDVARLRAAGLAKGGSLDNAIVISGDKVLNSEGLRYDDEFVRHKALDAVGDLYLAGAPIIGGFRGVCSGHAMNNALLRALFADDGAWRHDVLGADEAKDAVDGDIAAQG